MAKELPFQLEIISPTSHQVLSVTGIEIESPTGSFFVGYDHMPLISIIKKKSTLSYYLPDGSNMRIQVNGGIFNIAQNKSLILLDS